MRKTFLMGATSAMALLIAACGSNEDVVQNEPAAANDMNTTMADGSNPFADAEIRMNQRMMAAVGGDAGDSWARKMIEHHQGAIDMSQAVLDQSPKPEVAAMARQAIEKQRKDINDIRKLLKQGAPNQASAELYRPAMMDMQQKMQGATGADASELYMRKMLEHHKGAVAMSDVALQNGVSGALREQVQKTRDDNQKDAEMVEAMLGGQSREQAMAASGAKSPEQAKAEPAPADKAREKAVPKASSTPAPKAAPKPAPKPTPPVDPMAGHDMNNMQ